MWNLDQRNIRDLLNLNAWVGARPWPLRQPSPNYLVTVQAPAVAKRDVERAHTDGAAQQRGDAGEKETDDNVHAPHLQLSAIAASYSRSISLHAQLLPSWHTG